VWLQAGTDLNFEEESKYEILANTVSLVEQLKGRKINYSFENTEITSMQKSAGKYIVKVSIRHDGVSPKTKLERELAKIIFDSPYERFLELVKKMRTDGNTEQRMVFLKFIFMIFECLETRRVESCYGEIYRGANERFIEARFEDAKRFFPGLPIPHDPIDALRMAGFDQSEIVLKSEFPIAQEYIKAVELTGKKGGMDLAIMYWEKVVQPFLEKKFLENQRAIKGDGSNNDEKGNSKDTSEIQEKMKVMQEEMSNVRDPNTKKILKNAMEDLNTKSLNAANNEELSKLVTKPLRIWSEQRSDFAKKYAELKESGKTEIAKIEQQLEQLSNNQIRSKYSWDGIKKGIIEIKPTSGKPEKFNTNIAIKLKNIFKRIQGGINYEIDSVGDDIDVESYIDYKINRSGNFLRGTRAYVGFDIVIAIDESGSMEEKIPIARRMCATLYESISALPNVRMTIIGWTGNENICIVKKITKPSEISSLNASGFTPMGTAIWYCNHLIESQTSPKRLFILITDGEPNTDKDLDIGKEGVRQMRKRGVICNGICVGDHGDTYFKKLKRIFDDETTWCTSFDEVDDFLRKKISRQIISYLKKSE